MKDTVFAAVDIGSNAARLLIKRLEEDKLKKLLLLRVPLRLGFDVFAKGKVSAKKSEQLIRLLKAYRHLMRIYDVDIFRACATSAMRDAENGPALIKEIEEKTGIRIEIISGEEEARIVLKNNKEWHNGRNGNYLYVDVGGGSTEINFLANGELKKSMSFNIGTVRSITGKIKPTEWTRMSEELSPLPFSYHDIQIIGSGGNINKLYSLAKGKDVGRKTFLVEELQHIYGVLQPLNLKQRMDTFNLKADRADVIVPAAEIFLKIAESVKAEKIIVPVIGMADGIIDGLTENDMASQCK